MIPQTIFITRGSWLEKRAEITLNSVESFMRSQNVPAPTSKSEAMEMIARAKDPFYAEIVPAAPQLMQYILEADMTTNKQAIALDYAYLRHATDRVFIDKLMYYLSDPSVTAASRAVVGAYLTLCVGNLINQKEKKIIKVEQIIQKKVDNPEKHGKTTEGEKVLVDKEVTELKYKPGDLDFITKAISTLLGSTGNWIQSEYPTLNEAEAIGVAAAVCTANAYSIKMIVEMNLAITADVFNMLDDAGQNKIIISALELKKDDFQKLTTNQQAFIESLKRWVYGKLDYFSTTDIYGYLVSVYGLKPTDLSTRLIYLKDCGTSYVNLLQVAKQLEA